MILSMDFRTMDIVPLFIIVMDMYLVNIFIYGGREPK